MKLLLVVLTFALTKARDDDLKTILRSPTKTLQLYREFKGKQLLQFNSAEEDGVRFRLFKLNAHFVAELNNVEGDTAHFAINKFSAMTEAERESLLGLNMTGSEAEASEKDHAAPMMMNLKTPRPSRVIWLDKVTPVKDQGSCGSGWAFAAVGSLETRYAMETGVLRNFAEQECLDCASIYPYKTGCKHGRIDHCLEHARSEKHLAGTTDYPYRGARGSCLQRNTENSLVAARVSDTKSMQWESDNLAALGHGAIAMTIVATNRFTSYAWGILTDSTCNYRDNHAVTGVGYTPDYYLIKNSWGTDWGDQGFAKLARGYSGSCRLFYNSYYPILVSTGESEWRKADPATDYGQEEEEECCPCEKRRAEL